MCFVQYAFLSLSNVKGVAIKENKYW